MRSSPKPVRAFQALCRGLSPVLFTAQIVFLTFLIHTVAIAAPPNIVFVLADDLGYGDVHALNPDSKIATPNLDRLASEGMTFSDAHSPSAVCTPTRYALVTGRYAWRSRLTRGVLNGYGAPLIEPDRPTVASFLKSNGYHTAIIGKWHLGLGFQKSAADNAWDWSKPLTYSPKTIGFDFSYVIPASLDFPPYAYIQNGAFVEKPTLLQPASGFPAYIRKGERSPDFDFENCLDHLLSQSSEYLRHRTADAGKPFFLYFPLTAPHKPVLPHKRFRGATGLGPYADFVVQVDWTVGQLLKTLDELDLTRNTLVIVTSDNGSFMRRRNDTSEPDHVSDETVQAYNSVNHTANGPLRGTKADIWEAGHRVPFFARWPGRIEPGSRCDRTVCHVDFFATAAEIIRAPLPGASIAAPDSFSLVSLFEGRAGDFKRAPVIHHSGAGMFAIRNGDWKLVLGNGSGGREAPHGKRFARPWTLFNLKSDLGETGNQADEQADVVNGLVSNAFRIIADGRSR